MKKQKERHPATKENDIRPYTGSLPLFTVNIVNGPKLQVRTLTPNNLLVNIVYRPPGSCKQALGRRVEALWHPFEQIIPSVVCRPPVAHRSCPL